MGKPVLSALKKRRRLSEREKLQQDPVDRNWFTGEPLDPTITETTQRVANSLKGPQGRMLVKINEGRPSQVAAKNLWDLLNERRKKLKELWGEDRELSEVELGAMKVAEEMYRQRVMEKKKKRSAREKT